MPSVEFNRAIWRRYDWRCGGEEWSAAWGSTANLWHGTLMPRIGSFLGEVRAVEIGPGHGRLSAFLKDHCASLALVDLAENCIESCRQRFAGEPHLRYFVNDGMRFPFLEDESVEFVFSFDSLVHVDLETIASYLAEIDRVLVAGGHAVLHHSNLGALLDGDPPPRIRRHLRAPDVSAELVTAATARLPRLQCRLQELIAWDDSSRLLDCISTFVRREGRAMAPPERLVNPDFYHRATELQALSARYRLD